MRSFSRKQITFLEEQMIQMEKRMQDDVECLEADCKLKVQKLKDELLETERSYKAEKELMKVINFTYHLEVFSHLRYLFFRKNIQI